MGFRNPVTEVTDTFARERAEAAIVAADLAADAAQAAADAAAAPADAMDTRGATPRGVVVGAGVPKVTLHDGAGTSASWELSTPAGGATGGTFTAYRGATRYTAGAALNLDEREVPAGGYRPVASISGAERLEPIATGNLALNPTWAKNLGTPGAPWRRTYYFRGVDGVVQLGGMLELLPNMPLGAILATLPAGCRPVNGNEVFHVIANNNRGLRLDITTAGQLIYQVATSTDAVYSGGSYVSLSGVSFATDLAL